MTKALTLAGRRIAPDQPPYIIAEVSANHNGRLETAMRLVEAAREAGADAVKLQTYRPDTITLDADTPDFRIDGGLWHGRTLYELYDEAHTPWEWHKPLFEYARELGITMFSSPFDTTAVDLLEDLNTPAYKIASFEAVDLELIRYVAGTGKPMIISTGMADAEEIAEAVDTARSHGCNQLAVLHCVSSYPADARDYNLRTIPDMARRFSTLVGLSDHTPDNATAIASIALGACLVEKHFTLDRNGGGPDDSFSLEPKELASLCRDAQIAWQALGRVNYERAEGERGSLKFRRSLYFVKGMAAGERIDESCIRSIRPGYGLAPKHYRTIIGQRMRRPAARGEPVSFEHIDTAMSRP